MNFSVVAVLVFLLVEGAEALQDPQICYVLDGILFLYGIVLTVLYCRLKFQNRKENKPPASSAIYEGLDYQEMHPYSTLEASKAPPKELPPRKTSLKAPTEELLPQKTSSKE